jgi:hypothetical protein
MVVLLEQLVVPYMTGICQCTAGVNAETGAAQWERNFDDKNSNGTFDDGDATITSLTSYLNDNPSANVAQELTEVYAEATDKFIDKTAIPDLRGALD